MTPPDPTPPRSPSPSPSPSSSSSRPLGLFEATGVELEYMLVDRDTLAVLPAADRVFREAVAERAALGTDPDAAVDDAAVDDAAVADAAVADAAVADVEHDDVSWSNELALHVVELKTARPSPRLTGLADAFAAHARRVDAIAAAFGGRLLPTAMHPTMDPQRETRLWPHECGPVYRAYDRIFGCRGHGWSNLQSTHLNFPFADAGEFARLHAAIRIVLPLLPALAASSPFEEGRATGLLDTRMAHYRTNSTRVPSVAGVIVPEPVFEPDAYRREILGRMYADIAPLDPEGLLQGEFLNSRGAIARFDRGAIEIRVIDVQECPRVDLAIAWLVREVLRALASEEADGLGRQRSVATEALVAVLDRTIERGERAVVDDAELLAVLGASRPTEAGELWRALAEERIAAASDAGGSPAAPDADAAEHGPVVRDLLDRGCLARRILRAAGSSPSRGAIHAVYAALGDRLLENRLFDAEDFA